MLNDLSARLAEEKDLSEIVRLLIKDELGATRETLADPLLSSYGHIFQSIREDKNQALWVVTHNESVIATCHLTFIPSLSFKGSWRLNIENIHVDTRFQNQGIGTWMLQKAINLGREKDCNIVQLTTHKKRSRAKIFYEKLGFEATHEGMKLYLKEG